VGAIGGSVLSAGYWLVVLSMADALLARGGSGAAAAMLGAAALIVYAALVRWRHGER
jgi:hypothetical protein